MTALPYRFLAGYCLAFTLTFCSQSAFAVFIAGFETDAQGFDAASIYTGTGEFSTASDGAAEGSSALQFRTPDGAFVGAQSFGINQADLIAAAAAGETLLLDVSVATPNTTDFATVRAGVNSDKGFQESVDQAIPIDGTTVTLAYDLGGITTLDGSEGWAGLILAVNSKVGSDMTFRIDNIRTQGVPEPGALGLALLACTGLVRRR